MSDKRGVGGKGVYCGLGGKGCMVLVGEGEREGGVLVRGKGNRGWMGGCVGGEDVEERGRVRGA